MNITRAVNFTTRLSTNLWFDHQAEEAARYYCAIFPNSKLGRMTRYGKEGHEVHGMAEGSVMTVEFQLGDSRFLALNGGPHFKFNEAVSFIVHCETQGEIDYFWEKLSFDGDPQAQQCGWLKDKFGISWQVVPDVLTDLITDPHSERSQRAFGAMLRMKKLDISGLRRAFDGV